MKLLNKDGRFQFIKNQQVEIDKNLLKYKELEIVKQAKLDIKIDGADEDTPFTTNNYINNQINSLDEKNIDETLRQMIERISLNGIIEYLKSEDAKEFNKKFERIIKGEVNSNKYSLNVPASNWQFEESYLDDTIGFVPKAKKESTLKTMFTEIGKAIKKARTADNKEKKEKEEELNVMEFFSIIHVMSGKEKEFINKISGYFELLNNAFAMNQEAQIDAICQKIIIDIYESILFVNGYNKYIEFGALEKLKSPGAKVVDIDYIKNFGRVIPNDVVKKKIECDKMCVFDNYCVMYYDPSGETYAKPSAAKRDPILFGLINHSNKLYYIADWEDELCNLTLEKIAEKCSVSEIK